MWYIAKIRADGDVMTSRAHVPDETAARGEDGVVALLVDVDVLQERGDVRHVLLHDVHVGCDNSETQLVIQA